MTRMTDWCYETGANIEASGGLAFRVAPFLSAAGASRRHAAFWYRNANTGELWRLNYWAKGVGISLSPSCLPVLSSLGVSVSESAMPSRGTRLYTHLRRDIRAEDFLGPCLLHSFSLGGPGHEIEGMLVVLGVPRWLGYLARMPPEFEVAQSRAFGLTVGVAWAAMAANVSVLDYQGEVLEVLRVRSVADENGQRICA